MKVDMIVFVLDEVYVPLAVSIGRFLSRCCYLSNLGDCEFLIS